VGRTARAGPHCKLLYCMYQLLTHKPFLNQLCQDIPLRSSACVTSITSDQTAGNIFIAGFGDGSIRIFDRRLPPQQAYVCFTMSINRPGTDYSQFHHFRVVQEWSEHNAWVTNVQLQRNGNRELVSGRYVSYMPVVQHLSQTNAALS
jgi:hypothetical protein